MKTKKIQLQKAFRSLCIGFCFNALPVFAQTNQRAMVGSFETDGIIYSSQNIADLARLELEKQNAFTVIDKYEMQEKNKYTEENCFSISCLVEQAEKVNAEKIVSGSILRFGEKLVVTVRLIDVKQKSIEKASVIEFLNLQNELQKMIAISLNKLLGKENDPKLVNLLLNYNQPIESPKTRLKLNGPRVGMVVALGETGKILSASREEGGFDVYPTLSQIGYQFEMQYLSAGNFQALFEFLPMITGLDQNLLNPSLTVMHGLRLNDSGWEIGFGPSFSVNKLARGFNDTEGYFGSEEKWYRSSEWNSLAEKHGKIDENGHPIERTYSQTKRLDSRGDYHLVSSWVWAVGKTFKSGYLNMPVNIYVSPKKEGWLVGASLGFNISK